MSKKIAWILIGIVFVVLVVFVAADVTKSRSKSAQMEDINAQAAAYEAQINTLQADIEKKYKEMSVVEDVSYMSVAARIYSMDELNMLWGWAEKFQYPLTVVIDMDWDDNLTASVLGEIAAHSNWSVMLTGQSEDWISRIDEADAKLAEYNIANFRYAYFDDKATEEQLAALREYGWSGYSNSLGVVDSINVSYNTLMDDNDLSFIDHVLITDDNYLGKVAEDVVNDKSIFILAVDMKDYSRTFKGESVSRIFERFYQDHTGPDGDMKAVSLGEYINYYRSDRTNRKAAQEAYESYAAQKEQEIAELQEAINSLYE